MIEDTFPSLRWTTDDWLRLFAIDGAIADRLLDSIGAVTGKWHEGSANRRMALCGWDSTVYRANLEADRRLGIDVPPEFENPPNTHQFEK